jgi:quinoprotein glucose dehydrogenase
VLDTAVFRSRVREGRDPMPAFPEEVLSDENLDLVERYLRTLVVRDPAAEVANYDPVAGDIPLQLPTPPDRYSGPGIRYSGSQFAAAMLANNGLSAVAPPWTELVAYDLNEGTIKWRIPDGTIPGFVRLGITNTGGFRPRSGPVPTAGGLVFASTAGDRKVRAYDKDTGDLLWEHELEGSPEGIPAVYEVNGKQYVAFTAGAGTGYGPPGFTRIPGRIEAQGYHIFALPD